mmetsp:Transcript_21821/g.70452  ORF Transcript_21821/g.70452 Transcript_21821/m.70452 type:complete len:711 (+) Transcript_21821:30-2162(+)
MHKILCDAVQVRLNLLEQFHARQRQRIVVSAISTGVEEDGELREHCGERRAVLGRGRKARRELGVERVHLRERRLCRCGAERFVRGVLRALGCDASPERVEARTRDAAAAAAAAARDDGSAAVACAERRRGLVRGGRRRVEVRLALEEVVVGHYERESFGADDALVLPFAVRLDERLAEDAEHHSRAHVRADLAHERLKLIKLEHPVAVVVRILEHLHDALPVHLLLRLPRRHDGAHQVIRVHLSHRRVPNLLHDGERLHVLHELHVRLGHLPRSVERRVRGSDAVEAALLAEPNVRRAAVGVLGDELVHPVGGGERARQKHAQVQHRRLGQKLHRLWDDKGGEEPDALVLFAVAPQRRDKVNQAHLRETHQPVLLHVPVVEHLRHRLHFFLVPSAQIGVNLPDFTAELIDWEDPLVLAKLFELEHLFRVGRGDQPVERDRDGVPAHERTHAIPRALLGLRTLLRICPRAHPVLLCRNKLLCRLELRTQALQFAPLLRRNFRLNLDAGDVRLRLRRDRGSAAVLARGPRRRAPTRVEEHELARRLENRLHHQIAFRHLHELLLEPVRVRRLSKHREQPREVFEHGVAVPARHTLLLLPARGARVVEAILQTLIIAMLVPVWQENLDVFGLLVPLRLALGRAVQQRRGRLLVEALLRVAVAEVVMIERRRRRAVDRHVPHFALRLIQLHAQLRILLLERLGILDGAPHAVL